MRKSLSVLLCLIALACPSKQSDTSAPGKPNVRTTTVGDPTDAKNLRVDSVVAPAPVFFDKAILSTRVNAEGHATVDEKAIPKGSTAYFTMYLRESPVGLATRAVWLGENRSEIAKEEHDMKGAKVATFKLDTKKLSAGRYTVQGFWGGNIAEEKQFEIVAAAASVAKPPAAAPAKKK